MYLTMDDIMLDSHVQDLRQNFTFNYDAFAEINRIIKRSCSMSKEND